jgi:hypothetical protein
MERDSESDWPCEQPDKVERQDMVVYLKSLRDMFKGMFENLEKKMTDWQVSLEKNYQKFKLMWKRK